MTDQGASASGVASAFALGSRTTAPRRSASNNSRLTRVSLLGSSTPALPNSLKSGLVSVHSGASGPPAQAQPIAPNATAAIAARPAFKRTPAILLDPPQVRG